MLKRVYYYGVNEKLLDTKVSTLKTLQQGIESWLEPLTSSWSDGLAL